MVFALLLAITGLTISAVAIYYSVAGLAAIFAAAFYPIVVMGVSLELAKLVAASWLKKEWHRIPFFMKSYLTTAVLILMLITSMGIFGFLSKAHIEQTAAGQESVAQVERIKSELSRQQDIISRADLKIKQLQTSGTGADANIQSQIDKEQERIDSAYSRVQPAIDEQNQIINNQAKLYQDELSRIDDQLATLQKYIDAGDKDSIKKAQAMIGARQDGSWGRNTAALAEEWRKGRQQARADLLTKIESATNNPQARAALAEIKRIRKTVETEISESNKLINRLRQQIGKIGKAEDIDKQVDEQNDRIKNANLEIDRLTEEKFKIEGEYRKLEAEVGPIKYIAEFIYGEEADKNLLEKAVTWVIITIIFVFDPLAVLLLISAQMAWGWAREEKSIESFINQSNNELFEEIDKQEQQARDAEEKITPETHPYLYQGDFWKKPEGWEEVEPQVAKPESPTIPETINIQTPELKVEAIVEYVPTPTVDETVTADTTEHAADEDIDLDEESKKKTYMIKQNGKQVVKKKE